MKVPGIIKERNLLKQFESYIDKKEERIKERNYLRQ